MDLGISNDVTIFSAKEVSPQEKLRKLYARKEQLEVVKKRMEFYQKNPLIWYHQRFGEDVRNVKWSLWKNEYENHVWDGDIDPVAGAWQSLASHKHAALKSATGCGKTFAGSRIAFWFLDTYEDSLVVLVGPTYRQIKDTLLSEISRGYENFKKLRPNSNLTTLELRIGKDSGENTWKITTRTGGLVSSSNTDENEASVRLQGLHRKNMLFIIDEMPGIPASTYNAIYNTITGGKNNLILGLGNPDNEFDELHKFSKKSYVNDFRVSAYDFPNVVMNKDIIGGAVSKSSIDMRLTDLGPDNPLFLSRVRGITPDSSKSSLFDLAAFTSLCNVPFEGVTADDSYNAIGLDVSNSVDGDNSAAAIGYKNILLELHVFKCPNSSDIADNLVFDSEHLLENKHHDYNLPKLDSVGIREHNIGIDVIGPGLSTMHRFHNLGYENVANLNGAAKCVEERLPKDETGQVKFRFGNLRAQMYYELAYDIKRKQVFFNIANPVVLQGIKKVMTFINFIDKNGTLYVTPKEQIKKNIGGKSPDELDAIVYWNWVRKISSYGSEYEGVFSVSTL